MRNLIGIRRNRNVTTAEKTTEADYIDRGAAAYLRHAHSEYAALSLPKDFSYCGRIACVRTELCAPRNIPLTFLLVARAFPSADCARLVFTHCMTRSLSMNHECAGFGPEQMCSV